MSPSDAEIELRQLEEADEDWHDELERQRRHDDGWELPEFIPDYIRRRWLEQEPVL